jgi:hypothetical protein
MSIVFDGSISATIQIRGRSYTLVGSANITGSTAGGGGGGVGGGGSDVRLPGVKLGYHASFNDAMSLGTLGSIVSGAQTLIDDIVVTLHLPAGFKDEWNNNITAKLNQLPAPLGSLYSNILANVELRITDIELLLDAPAAVNTAYSKGSVTLGFGFDCSQIDPNDRKLLGITLQAIGVKFSVGLSA